MASGHPIKPKYKDRTGERFGRLIVVSYAGPDKVGNARWHCRCDCGNEVAAVFVKALKTGNTRSCGCLRIEAVQARSTHGATRGGKRMPEYYSYKHMIQRCTNTKNKNWADYGGRGITVCDRWRHDFAVFLADMGLRPARGYELDRIDNDGNYEPGNCQWATRTEQNNNKRSNTLLAWEGRVQTLQQWADEVGVSSSLLCQRIGRLGWPLGEALGFVPHVNGNMKLTDADRVQHVQARTAANHKLGSASRLLCAWCGRQAETWHHYCGYEPEHWLTVLPLCYKCHGGK